jgi:hypothetical protein
MTHSEMFTGVSDMRSAISSDGMVGNIYDGVFDPGDIPRDSFSLSHKKLLLMIPLNGCLSPLRISQFGYKLCAHDGAVYEAATLSKVGCHDALGYDDDDVHACRKRNGRRKGCLDGQRTKCHLPTMKRHGGDRWYSC